MTQTGTTQKITLPAAAIARHLEAARCYRCKGSMHVYDDGYGQLLASCDCSGSVMPVGDMQPITVLVG